MRTIYPKLITTLFIILLAALIVRQTGATGQPNSRDTRQSMGYTARK